MRPWPILISDFSHTRLTGLWFCSFVTLIVLSDKVGGPALLTKKRLLKIKLALLGSFMLTGTGVKIIWSL